MINIDLAQVIALVAPLALIFGLWWREAVRQATVAAQIANIKEWIERHERMDIETHRELLKKVDGMAKSMTTMVQEITILKTEVEHIHQCLDKLQK